MRISKSKKLFIVIGILSLAILVAITPFAIEYYIIWKTAKEYRIDKVVFSKLALNEMTKHPNRTSAVKFLNPPFQKKYNLNMDDYLDSKGYFFPSGSHWKEWNIRTKTASIIMWKETDVPTENGHRQQLTAIEIRRAIKELDEFYKRNDSSISVIHVLNAVFDTTN